MEAAAQDADDTDAMDDNHGLKPSSSEAFPTHVTAVPADPEPESLTTAAAPEAAPGAADADIRRCSSSSTSSTSSNNSSNGPSEGDVAQGQKSADTSPPAASRKFWVPLQPRRSSREHKQRVDLKTVYQRPLPKRERSEKTRKAINVVANFPKVCEWSRCLTKVKKWVGILLKEQAVLSKAKDTTGDLKKSLLLDCIVSRVGEAKRSIRSVLQGLARCHHDGPRWKELEESSKGNIDIDKVRCTKCHRLDSTKNNDIVMCDMSGCYRAFHQRCLDPFVPSSVLESEESWYCWQCCAIEECYQVINDACGSSYSLPGTAWKDVFAEEAKPPKASVAEDAQLKPKAEPKSKAEPEFEVKPARDPPPPPPATTLRARVQMPIRVQPRRTPKDKVEIWRLPSSRLLKEARQRRIGAFSLSFPYSIWSRTLCKVQSCLVAYRHSLPDVDDNNILKIKQAIKHQLQTLADMHSDGPRWDGLEAKAKKSHNEMDIDEVQCTKCEGVDTTRGNDIIMCEMKGCYKAFHQKCLDPPVQSDVVNSPQPWYCWQCSTIQDCYDAINPVFGTSYRLAELKCTDIFKETCKKEKTGATTPRADTTPTLEAKRARLAMPGHWALANRPKRTKKPVLKCTTPSPTVEKASQGGRRNAFAFNSTSLMINNFPSTSIWYRCFAKVRSQLVYARQEQERMERNPPKDDTSRARSLCRLAKSRLAIRGALQMLEKQHSEGPRWDSIEPDGNDEVDVDQIACTKCGSLESSDSNDIVMCDKEGCFRAFHQRCLEPHIPASVLQDETPWYCWRCSTISACYNAINQTFGTRFRLPGTQHSDVFPEAEQEVLNESKKFEKSKPRDDYGSDESSAEEWKPRTSDSCRKAGRHEAAHKTHSAKPKPSTKKSHTSKSTSPKHGTTAKSPSPIRADTENAGKPPPAPEIRVPIQKIQVPRVAIQKIRPPKLTELDLDRDDGEEATSSNAGATTPDPKTLTPSNASPPSHPPRVAIQKITPKASQASRRSQRYATPDEDLHREEHDDISLHTPLRGVRRSKRARKPKVIFSPDVKVPSATKRHSGSRRHTPITRGVFARSRQQVLKHVAVIKRCKILLSGEGGPMTEEETRLAKVKLAWTKLGIRTEIQAIGEMFIHDETSEVNVDNIVCMNCRSSDVSEQNDIVICRMAGCVRAFHRQCLNPAIPDGADWCCWHCETIQECYQGINEVWGTSYQLPGTRWTDVFPEAEEESQADDGEGLEELLEDDYEDDYEDDEDDDEDGDRDWDEDADPDWDSDELLHGDDDGYMYRMYRKRGRESEDFSLKAPLKETSKKRQRTSGHQTTVHQTPKASEEDTHESPLARPEEVAGSPDPSSTDSCVLYGAEDQEVDPSGFLKHSIFVDLGQPLPAPQEEDAQSWEVPNPQARSVEPVHEAILDEDSLTRVLARRSESLRSPERPSFGVDDWAALTTATSTPKQDPSSSTSQDIFQGHMFNVPIFSNPMMDIEYIIDDIEWNG